MSKVFLPLLLALGLLGCTHSLHISHVSDFGPTYKAMKDGQLIKAESEQFVILGFVMNTDYVDQAYQDLQSKCPKGNIQGITTQYSTDHGFFSWTHHIDMQGVCLKN